MQLKSGPRVCVCFMTSVCQSRVCSECLSHLFFLLSSGLQVWPCLLGVTVGSEWEAAWWVFCMVLLLMLFWCRLNLFWWRSSCAPLQVYFAAWNVLAVCSLEVEENSGCRADSGVKLGGVEGPHLSWALRLWPSYSTFCALTLLEEEVIPTLGGVMRVNLDHICQVLGFLETSYLKTWDISFCDIILLNMK